VATSATHTSEKPPRNENGHLVPRNREGEEHEGEEQELEEGEEKKKERGRNRRRVLLCLSVCLSVCLSPLP
jgi:hypothetical protein